MKCDTCNKTATVHLTEIRNGKQIEKHLCEQCAAAAEGMLPAVKSHTPINELLTNFVMQHAGLQKEAGAACGHCGITWGEFRQSGLFGCEHDYDVFEKDLVPILQRAHEGATRHVGKSPNRTAGRPAAPKPKKRTIDIGRLKRDLQKAVEAEDYEQAARLRDQIREAEGL